MFTSRAEYRILLRQDNADERLSPLGHQLGLVADEQMRTLDKKYSQRAVIMDFIRTHNAVPAEVNPLLTALDTPPLSQPVKYETLLLRPQVNLQQLIQSSPALQQFLAEVSATDEELEISEIALKYASYIKKEEEQAHRMVNLENIKLPPQIDYYSLVSLSMEAREKLTRVKPANLGQASRISGVSPSDIAALMIYLRQSV